MKLEKLFIDFFNSEKAGGLLLIFFTVISLVFANSPLSHSYIRIWHYHFAGYSVIQWINDGLMAIFFLMIGLELEREIYRGELSSVKSASLPVVAAMGGMLVPALLYTLLNIGTPTQSGAGIPMATDIAFALGILSLFGNRVPPSIKIFLAALAVIDDLGAIFVIAFFYTSQILYTNLMIAFAIFGFLIILNRFRVKNLIPYLVGGIAMWYFMHHSGVHATITGVLLAFAIPFSGGDRSPSSRLQHMLHRPVAFVILPLFALANTCIVLGSNWAEGLLQMNSLGIAAGLVIGKPLGILLFCYISVRFRVCSLPDHFRWKQLAGVAFLGGIGFTMSIFITLLAFDQSRIINSSKIAVLLASLASAVAGLLLLNRTLGPPPEEESENVQPGPEIV
jgi:Na+:H+ antiporter, NhaA family